MPERPYTLLSCSVSIDGYIGNGGSRLLLSNEADFDRVDAVRASCDAILVGAATVRIDNPRLLVRSQARRDARAARARGLADEGTVTRAGSTRAATSLRPVTREDPTTAASPQVTDARKRLGPVATVVDAGHEWRCARSARPRRAWRRAADGRGGATGAHAVSHRGPRRRAATERRARVRRRLRGSEVRARRPFPLELGRRAALVDVRQIGDVVLLRYALSSRFEDR